MTSPSPLSPSSSASPLRSRLAAAGVSTALGGEPVRADPPRAILHVDLDCFFVSVERVLDPRLSQRPVIVGGRPDSRGVVCSASHEARAFGVRNGMPSAAARRLCPDAIFLPGRGRLYGSASAAAMKVLAEMGGEVERASIDEAYVDVTDAPDDSFEIAARIRRELLQRLGLPASVGIGANKLVAKVACGRAKPDGILEVWPGYEQAFFADLPLADIPGVGPVLGEQLRLFGLRTAADVLRVDARLLEATFGSSGRSLARKVRGVGPARLRVGEAPRSIGQERTFARDVVSREPLVEVLREAAHAIAARASRRGLAGRTVTLKLRTAAFRTITRSRTVPTPTRQADELLAVGELLLGRAIEGLGPLRLAGLSLSGLTAEPVQRELFGGPEPGDEAGRAGGPLPPAILGGGDRDAGDLPSPAGGDAQELDARVEPDSADGRGVRLGTLLPESLSGTGVRGTGRWLRRSEPPPSRRPSGH